MGMAIVLDPSEGAKGSQEGLGWLRIFNSSLDRGTRLQVDHAIFLEAKIKITYNGYKMHTWVLGGSFLKETNVFSKLGDLRGEEPMKMQVDEMKRFVVIYNGNF